MYKIIISSIFLAITGTITMSSIGLAQPYGKGLYGIITYGNETSLSISTDAIGGNVAIPTITPISGGALGTATNVVTITSTDVIGFKLYIGALSSTNMDNLGATIPASANTYANPATVPLAVNTWGYNVDGSVVNFCGMPLDSSRQLIKTVTTPTTSGDNTTITYGLKIDMAKPAGNYSVDVVYTAVPQTD